MATLKKTPKTALDEIELHPDAWKRFEAGIRSLARTPPQAGKPKSASKKPPKKA